MARACPSCGRPNSDSAMRCLYCVASLPPPHGSTPDDPPGASASKETLSAERHLLILLPDGGLDEGAVAELARIAGVAVYDARLSLSIRRPRLFRRIDSEAEARRLSSELSRSRIPHYVVSESAVLALPVATASALDLLDRHFELSVGAGAPSVHRLPYEELLLLVRGEITRERHHESRVGSPRGASRRLTPGLRLHLYSREASLAVEIDPERFDFRALEGAATSSALLNLERLIARLSERSPGLPVDRGFDQEPQVLSRSGGGEELTEALSEGPGGILYDDEANFRFYARWRYRLARHLWRGPARG